MASQVGPGRFGLLCVGTPIPTPQGLQPVFSACLGIFLDKDGLGKLWKPAARRLYRGRELGVGEEAGTEASSCFRFLKPSRALPAGCPEGASQQGAGSVGLSPLPRGPCLSWHPARLAGCS